VLLAEASWRVAYQSPAQLARRALADGPPELNEVFSIRVWFPKHCGKTRREVSRVAQRLAALGASGEFRLLATWGERQILLRNAVNDNPGEQRQAQSRQMTPAIVLAPATACVAKGIAGPSHKDQTRRHSQATAASRVVIASAQGSATKWTRTSRW